MVRVTGLRSALIVSEVALSLILLAAAGLLINSFWRLLHTDAGFDPRSVLALDIPLSRATYTKPEQRSAAFQQLIQRMKNVPGVRDASVVSNVPLTDFDVEVSFQIEGRPPYKPGEEAAADYTVASGDYFRTMNIALLRGRVFTDADTTKFTAGDGRQQCVCKALLSKRGRGWQTADHGW